MDLTEIINIYKTGNNNHIFYSKVGFFPQDHGSSAPTPALQFFLTHLYFSLFGKGMCTTDSAFESFDLNF